MSKLERSLMKLQSRISLDEFRFFFINFYFIIYCNEFMICVLDFQRTTSSQYYNYNNGILTAHSVYPTPVEKFELISGNGIM